MIKISIIIPTYNRLEQLKRVLKAFETQTYSNDEFEVLVISDGSTDGTDEYLSTLDTPLNLQAIFQSNQGVASARNRGINQAIGDIILFVDDDIIPTSQLIEQHMDWHAQYGDQVVIIGPMLSPPDFRMSPWVLWEQEALAKQYRDMQDGKWQPTARQFYTGNTSLARKRLIENKGFDPAFRRAEDVELAYRLADHSIRFLFNPAAIGYHYAERSFQSWIAVPYIYGRNDIVFASQKGQPWLLDTIFREFKTRHFLIQFLTWSCLDRPGVSAVAAGLLRGMLAADRGRGLSGLTNLACSGLFNLRYYQGVADGLGGRAAFFAGLGKGRIAYANSN